MKKLLLLTCCCAAYLMTAGSAGAATFNVTDGAQFAAALTSSMGNGSGGDQINLAAGTYLTGTGFVVVAASGDPLTIVGAGSSTVLKPTASNIDTLTVNFSNAETSSVSNLKILPFDGVDTGNPVGLFINGGSASAVSVGVDGATDNNTASGITTGSTTTLLQDIQVTAAGADLTALNAGGNVELRRASLDGDSAAGTTAINSTGGSITVKNTRIAGFATGLTTNQSTAYIWDSAVVLPAGGTGVRFKPNGVNRWLVMTNISIYGTGTSKSVVIAPYGGGTANASISESILQIASPSGYALECGTATTLSTVRSMRNMGANAYIDPDCGLTETNPVDVATNDPGFVNPAAGNLALLATSPAIDAGSIVPDDPSRKDLAGKARKNGDTIDLGAYEYYYVPVEPPVVPPVVPPITPLPAATLTLSKFSSRVKFKSLRQLKNGFSVSTKKPKGAYVKAVSSTAQSLALTLYKGKKKLTGSQTLKLPAGTSYITFRGKWNKKALASGAYKLNAILDPNKVPNRLSMNVTTPKT